MEKKDDFESLLKGIATRYEEALHSEKPVSEMIDARMAASKARVMQSFRKEIVIIIGLLIFTVLVFVPGFKFSLFAPDRIPVMKMICALSLAYSVAGIVLYVWLIRLSSSQKGMDTRQYITQLYKKTKQVLTLYLWMSTIINSSLIPLALLLMYKTSLAWIPIIAVSAVVIHYLNVWYINKRFGRGLRELESLIAEFN